MNETPNESLLPLLFRSARPYLWPAIGFNTVLASRVSDLPLDVGAVLALSLMLCASAGFLFNDILDREIDRVNGRSRLQRLSWHGCILTVLAAIACWGLAVTISYSLLPARHYTTVAAVALGTALYSIPIRSIPGISTLLASVLCASPLLVPIVVAGTTISWSCASLIGSALCFFLARETILDVRDLEGDSQQGRLTIPILFGRMIAIRLAQSCIIVSFVLMAAMPFLLESFAARFLAALGLATFIILCLVPAARISDNSVEGIVCFVRRSSKAFVLNVPLVVLALLAD